MSQALLFLLGASALIYDEQEELRSKMMAVAEQRKAEWPALRCRVRVVDEAANPKTRLERTYGLSAERAFVFWEHGTSKGMTDGVNDWEVNNYGGGNAPSNNVLSVKRFVRENCFFVELTPLVMAHQFSMLSKKGLIPSPLSALPFVGNAKSRVRLEREKAGDAERTKVLFFYLPESADKPTEVIVLADDMGFAIVREERYQRTRSDKPYFVATNEYGTVGSNRQPVVVRRRESRLTFNSKTKDLVETATRTIEISDLEVIDEHGMPKDPVEFMKLPKGARIDDKISGKQYLYGMPAVTEADIDKEVKALAREHFEATKHHYPDFEWKWLFIGLGAFTAVFCSLGYLSIWLRRKKAAA